MGNGWIRWGSEKYQNPFAFNNGSGGPHILILPLLTVQPDRAQENARIPPESKFPKFLQVHDSAKFRGKGFCGSENSSGTP